MSKIDNLIKKYLKELKQNYKDFDKNLFIIQKAVDIAKIAHEWQFRKYSGKPFILHPLRVAIMVAQRCDDLDLILAAILHDTVEDSPEKVSMETIYKEFWDEVWFLVDSVTDNVFYYYQKKDNIFDDKVDKLLYGGMKDIRCFVLKIFDREHNLKTLDWLKEKKQIRMWFETQALYIPLKEILNCDYGNIKIDVAQKNFDDYLKKYKISDFDELKWFLYSKLFNNFDKETFNVVYKNTQNVIWKIEDIEMYKKLVETKNFDENVDVLSIERWLDDSFLCTFVYKKGWFYKHNAKVSIQDTYFNINK